MSRHVAAAVIGLMLGASAVTAQESTADRSTVDLFAGAGKFLTDDGGLTTAEGGVTAWLTPGFGLGLRHSFHYGDYWGGESQRSHVSLLTVNFREELTPRVQLHFAWVPLFHSARIRSYGTKHSWGMGPILDFFLDVDVPDRRFRLRAGVNLLPPFLEGAWIHPMVLAVFPFP